MGERKGQNHYYPPDFDPKKHKSLAGYHGQHPLRERARKLHQGILIIRFEMPYNIWCDGCNNHIGMGVRYNAEKSKLGMYYTTPIYNFRMKCHLCDNHFEIKTDPANHDYVITTGARRKEQRWDPKENEQIVPEDRESQKKLALDAMYKLEHGSEDQSKVKKAMPMLARMAEKQAGLKEDYLLNKLAREKFRGEKKALKAEKDEDDALLSKASLDIRLVKEHEEDIRVARLFKYNSVDTFEEKQKQKRAKIERRSLFSVLHKSPSSATTPQSVTSTSSSDSNSSGTSSRCDWSAVGLKAAAKTQQLSDARAKFGLAFKSRKRTSSGSEKHACNLTRKDSSSAELATPAFRRPVDDVQRRNLTSSSREQHCREDALQSETSTDSIEMVKRDSNTQLGCDKVKSLAQGSLVSYVGGTSGSSSEEESGE